MSSDNVIETGLQSETSNEEKEQKSKKVRVMLKHICKAIGISVFGIIAVCMLFCIPWTIIPRTNSIIYQTYWMEIMLPTVSTLGVLFAAQQMLNLRLWTKEEKLLSIINYLKMYFLRVITGIVFHITSHAIWTIYLKYNHPLPRYGLIAYWITFIIFI